MRLHSLRLGKRVVFVVALAVGVTVAVDCTAIALGQLDDFQDGTTQNWGIGQGGAQPVGNVPDAGPSGAGDDALFMDTDVHGSGRLLVINTVQWTGDWSATGLAQVSMDVRNPNASSLSMRLGIAGPGGVTSFGGGDTYVTNAISVPADDAWHSITFDVLAENFTALGGMDLAAALAEVTHVRILNNAAQSFIGDLGGAFYLDNILAVGAAANVDGDYNGNGIVDAADYTVWRDTEGQGGPNLPADGNGDMSVNSADYDYWKERFGNESGAGAVATNGAGLAIPEPAGVLLAVMLLLVACMWRWCDLRAAANRSEGTCYLFCI